MNYRKMIWLYVLLHLFCTRIYGEQIEQKLIDHLLRNVSRYARPVYHPSESINATFGIELVQLVKVDAREQLVTTKVWVRQTWTTDIFKWDWTKWSGIKQIQIDASKVWTPDIVLYNNGDSHFSGGTVKYKTLVNIDWDGKCSWLAPATFISNCAIDIREFPFDKQTCILKFGSWTFDAKGINLTTDSSPLITSQYVNSSEWTIQKAIKIANSIRYDCCPHPFIDVTFKFILLRKPLYYIFNVIAPCLVLVLAVLFGFFLPPESGERISLTITILLAVAVFLQLVSDALPRNSDSIPMLAVFYMVVMAESAFSLITTCIVLVYHYRGLECNSSPMPKWMKRLFLNHMAKFLCIKRHSTSEEEDETMAVINNLADISHMMYPEKNLAPIENGFSNATYRPSSPALSEYSGGDKNFNTPIFASILKELKIVSGKLRELDRQGDIQDDWKFLARVLDRLFFWLFLVTVVCSCISILLPAYFVHN